MSAIGPKAGGTLSSQFTVGGTDHRPPPRFAALEAAHLIAGDHSLSRDRHAASPRLPRFRPEATRELTRVRRESEGRVRHVPLQPHPVEPRKAGAQLDLEPDEESVLRVPAYTGVAAVVT